MELHLAVTQKKIQEKISSKDEDKTLEHEQKEKKVDQIKEETPEEKTMREKVERQMADQLKSYQDGFVE